MGGRSDQMFYRPWCLHCGKRRANRPGGYCWNCYYTPGVRPIIRGPEKKSDGGTPGNRSDSGNSAPDRV